jgi:Ankyrin repeats (3 copies)
VAQQVTDDWVLELIDHDGYAVNVTLQPGEMIMYESHSILHGRPYPLNGQYYANCFFHYEPIGYTEQYYANLERRKQPQKDHQSSTNTVTIRTTQEMFEAALAKLALTEQKFESTALSTTTSDTTSKMTETTTTSTTTNIPKKLPYSIREGTIEAQRWRQEFEFHRVTLRHESWDDDVMIDENMFPKIIPKQSNQLNTIGATSAHILAAKNDVKRLREVAKTDPKSLDTTDINGWLPLHEAARGGCTEAVQYLVEEFGIADINARTNDGKGATALWWAEHGLAENHKVIQILKRNGAISIAPFQKKKKTGLKIDPPNKKEAIEEKADDQGDTEKDKEVKEE